MSAVRADNTVPEQVVRRYLFSKGFRFRKNDTRHPGRPDVVLPKYRAVVFVHGCFWHGHLGCKKSKLPTARRDFWSNKIHNTRQRDLRNVAAIESSGWNVITVWECDLDNKTKKTNRLDRLVDEIRWAESGESEFPADEAIP